MGETGLLNLLLFFLIEIVLTFDFNFNILIIIFPLINMNNSVLNIINNFTLWLIEFLQEIVNHIRVENTRVESVELFFFLF